MLMYCSIVSTIASASSSSEYSWSESRLKSGDLNLSRLRVLKCLNLDDRNSRSRFVLKEGRKDFARKSINSVSVPDDRYAFGINIDRKTRVVTSTLPDFASVFQFNNRVTALEQEVAELKKDPLHTQVTALVDEHLDAKAWEKHKDECQELPYASTHYKDQ
ncbi:hypothetical protein Tco_0290310 [Tanacetum coccineum]